MKRVYTHENRLLVSHAKNILDNANIDNTLKNEFAAGAMGDIAPLDAWMELWVVNESDYDTSTSLLETIENSHTITTDTSTWACSHCKEANPAHFMFCWNCQRQQP
ncbi:putative signal transducing protein [Eionea flava]